ncbi:hypothetical protein [Flagellimonas flava]|uniref:hypothetical protein n=1 Tax=Flagellimonas flava TaxID=570519 RepID=UPI003D64D776
MNTQYFKYKKHTDTWFWTICAIFLGGILAVILAKGIIGNPNQIWKVLLVLSPFIFILFTLIRIVIYRQAYEREGGNKIVILDKEIPKLIIHDGITKKEILPSEIGHLKLFESYGDGPPFTDFTYIEIVLKTGESIIIPDRIANTSDLSPILKGKRRIRKKRFMNRIKTPSNTVNN